MGALGRLLECLEGLYADCRSLIWYFWALSRLRKTISWSKDVPLIMRGPPESPYSRKMFMLSSNKLWSWYWSRMQWDKSLVKGLSMRDRRDEISGPQRLQQKTFELGCPYLASSWSWWNKVKYWSDLVQYFLIRQGRVLLNCHQLKSLQRDREFNVRQQEPNSSRSKTLCYDFDSLGELFE